MKRGISFSSVLSIPINDPRFNRFTLSTSFFPFISKVFYPHDMSIKYFNLSLLLKLFTPSKRTMTNQQCHSIFQKMTIKIYTQNLHIPYFSSKLSLPRKFELATIHGFVLLSPHISQVITLIISLTYIKSCWGNFESKTFYLGFTSPLCTTLPSHNSQSLLEYFHQKTTILITFSNLFF